MTFAAGNMYQWIRSYVDVATGAKTHCKSFETINVWAVFVRQSQVTIGDGLISIMFCWSGQVVRYAGIMASTWNIMLTIIEMDSLSDNK